LINTIYKSDISNTEKNSCINKAVLNNIKIINCNRKELIVKYKNRIINIKNLYYVFKNFSKGTFVNKNYIQTLIDKIRKLKYEAKIVIGDIKDETLDSNRIHVWIEFLKNEKTYIIDVSNSVVIDKDSFYMFYKPEILNEIKKDEVINDELLSILVNDLSIQYAEYLIFNKKLEKELKRKKGYFYKIALLITSFTSIIINVTYHVFKYLFYFDFSCVCPILCWCYVTINY